MLHVDGIHFTNPEEIEKWVAELDTNFPEEISEKIKEADSPCMYGLFKFKNQDNKLDLQQFIIAEQEAVKLPGNTLGVRVGCCLDDEEISRQKEGFQNVWNGFLRLYNLFQFLPFAYFVTKEGIKKNAYDGLKLYDEQVFQSGGPTVEPGKEEWEELKEMVDGTLHGILDQLKENDWSVPEAGYELEGTKGEVVACAELAWENLKIAFLLEEELGYKNQFKEVGWKTYPIQEVLESPDEYMTLNKSEKG